MVRPFGTGSIPGVLRPPTPLWGYAAEERQQRDLIIGGAAQFRADQPSVQICGNAIGIAPVEGNHLLSGIFDHYLVAGAEMNSLGMPDPFDVPHGFQKVFDVCVSGGLGQPVVLTVVCEFVQFQSGDLGTWGERCEDATDSRRMTAAEGKYQTGGYESLHSGLQGRS